MKLTKTLISIIFVLGIFASKNVNSQTGGTLSLNVTTIFTGGSWGAKSNFVVWIENSTGTFVKTRALYGGETDHLIQWTSKTPTQSTVDATVGATATTNPKSYTAISWNASDLTGSTPFNLLPDGNYTVGMELAWSSSMVLGTGRQYFTASFTKGPAPQTVTPADQTNFTGITLQWTPATLSVTTSALSSNSYCLGTTVNVPFTIGSGTVFNNNTWTAQLSDATGSFASPTTIGTLTSAAAGTIAATIPAGTPVGTAYRIRVIGSQPNSTGTDNGTNIAITTAPTAPTVGTITQPTCTTSGSVILNGLPATSSWTINPGNISGTGTTGTVTGLSAGTYTYTVTSGCVSPASANVVISAPPANLPSPTVGTITQPTCALATGSVVLNGLPASGSWTVNPGAVAGSGTSTTISGLASGTHNFTVSNATLCPSAPSANVVINLQPETPNVADQTTSVMTGDVFIVSPTGVPAGTTYSWSAPVYTNGVSGGSAATGQTSISQTLSLATGTGTATYTVTPTSGACVGTAFTVTVTVTTVCAPVSIVFHPANSSICQTSGSTTFSVTATGTSPFVYQWQYYDGTAWSSVVNGTPAGATYTNATTSILGVNGITAIGNPQYRCHITNCSGNNNATSNNVTLTVNAPPPTPMVTTIIQPSCNVSTASIVIDSLPTSGSWTINPGNHTGIGTSTTIMGLAAGTYNFTVTNAQTCTSAPTPNVVINAQPATPPTPTITFNTNVLHSDATTGNQWYNQSGIIIGATAQDFTVINNSGYYDIVTLNGCSSVPSNTIQTNVGIESINNITTISVYPNPVANELTIEMKGNTKPFGFEILNSTGQLIFKDNMTEKTVVQTTNFAKGIYLIKLENGKSFEFKKIVKE
ncbi:MAG: T9SS type A sorting domain-containing protein [Bacteroidota bacterium]